MSLLLRKNCQPLLDNVGLTPYHVRINDNKHLQIVSKCGKPLVTISGIEFTRNQPSKDEIEFATELFAAFITANHQALEDHLQEVIAYGALTPVPGTHNDYVIGNHRDGGYQNPYEEHIHYDDGAFRIQLTTLGAIRTISYRATDGNPKPTIQELQNFVFNQATYDAALAYLDAYSAYQAATAHLQDSANELNQCNI